MSSSVDSTRYLELLPLTPLDQTSTRVYITNHLSFRLTDPESGLAPLEDGVNRLFSALPMLAGTMVPHVDDESKYHVLPFIRESEEDSFLRVAHHDLSISTAQISPWYPIPAEDLGNKPIVSWAESCACLRPIADDEQKLPMLRFQSNVMSDGLVLTMTYNHSIFDETGAGIILEALGECCRVPKTNEHLSLLSQLARDEVKLRQVLLNTRPVGHSDISDPKPMTANTASENGSEKVPESPDNACPPTPITRKFSFCPVRLGRLKAHCNSLLPSPILSSNDVLTALLAIGMHEARGIAPSGVFMMAVNLRGRLHSLELSSYLGNVVTALQVPLPPNRLSCECEMKHDDLQKVAQVASLIRQQVTSIDEQFVWQLIESKRVPDASAFTPSPFLAVVSSWRHMKTHSVDFGPILGHIDTFEMDMPPFINSSVIMPQHMTKDPVWEVNITLANNSSFDTLVKSSLFYLVGESSVHTASGCSIL
ncbi:hypothetical protein PENSOL_c087G07416 [Penicillium solitum]|uniref:Condensation domain-containing protein n=1 Tax=Penicillium solitum TaxID=60172 RepID=A0A1V6QBR1_9EURO|nr:uncharacterized protein PENSOL_c087G07416 [Penicillium solitum]OQD86447.1 hypothetical protein PENSOL_c087G07416 [Penicillium solitum]